MCSDLSFNKFKKIDMVIRILLIMMVPFMCLGQLTPREGNPVNNGMNEPGNVEIMRKSPFNLEELKVRWKKAALENCPGVPCVTTPASACGSITSVLDGDGNSYQTVGIGTQCWTKTNLKTTKYNDGVTSIPELTSNSDWAAAITGARTVYGGSSPVTGYVSTYGYLYNWYAVADPKGLCPIGWHVPTDAEWTNLIQFIDPLALATGPYPQSSTAGTVMKEMSSLWTTDLGTNTSGFSALPGGVRFGFGGFTAISTSALFWSATDNPPSNFPWFRELVFVDGSVGRDANLKSAGLSVRCLKN
jgi:uncharacterized protein (TIGR02145 family)